MDNISITLKKLDLIQRHIHLVQDACETLGRRLIERGEVEFGVKLIANGYLHDQSKFDQFERKYLINNEDKDTLKLAIFKHQAGNKHHIEFWDNIENMPRIFIAELVCDLFARSAEFGTDLRAYIKDKFVPLHNISTSSKGYKNIKDFLDLLLETPFSQVK